VRAPVALLVVLLAGACAARKPETPAPAACVLGVEPLAIAVDAPADDERHELLDLPDDPTWWAPAPPDPVRDAYRTALEKRLGPDGLLPRVLLLRQRAVFAALPGDRSREVENADALASGSAGSLGPVTCLEWLLFQRQDRRFPMIEHPTELGAWILRGNGRVRVYLSSADRVGGRLRREVTDRVAADAAAGFVPVAHLHNHPFMLDRRPGDRTWATVDTVPDVGGALAPSLSDVQLWRNMRERLGLRGGWVTNGLDTARYTSADMDRLSAWP
jgi:hypothetical protein